MYWEGGGGGGGKGTVLESSSIYYTAFSAYKRPTSDSHSSDLAAQMAFYTDSNSRTYINMEMLFIAIIF